MEGTKTMTIEQEIGELKNDAFRFGLQGVKSDFVGSHPLETSYYSASIREEKMKRKILADTYGSAFPLKMELDRKIISSFQRPPGPIPSSMLGLESTTGALENFGVEDFLKIHVTWRHYALLTCIMDWKFVLASRRVQSAIVSCEGFMLELSSFD